MTSVFLFYDERFDDVASITLPWWRRYCYRHNYDLTIHRGGYAHRIRNISFQKTEMAGAILPGTDLLLVADLDTLVTDQTRHLEEFIDPQHSLFGCEDINGFNAGVYMVRNCPEGRDLMEFAVAYGKCAPDGHGDQNAIRKWIDFNPHEYQRVPHPAFNSYLYQEYGEQRTREDGQWERGDFILHLPGMTNERRIKLMEERLHHIIE